MLLGLTHSKSEGLFCIFVNATLVTLHTLSNPIRAPHLCTLPKISLWAVHTNVSVTKSIFGVFLQLLICSADSAPDFVWLWQSVTGWKRRVAYLHVKVPLNCAPCHLDPSDLNIWIHSLLLHKSTTMTILMSQSLLDGTNTTKWQEKSTPNVCSMQ